MATPKLKLIPLGGLGEIGKNMMVVECGDDLVIIDAGLMFPEEEMLGVDLVIPDITYLLEHKKRIRGIVITHGHEDHIGALPYLIRQLDCPIYSTRLSNGLIEVKLKEHRVLNGTQLKVVPPGGQFNLGKLRVELVRVSHSIPDAVAVALHTPQGIVIHTGDFKVDHTPVDAQPIDLARFAELGAQGVFALLSDSTYAELPGYTPSERVVGRALDRIIGEAPGRVIVATFASLIARVQQVIDASVHHGRRVFVAGRSMVDNVHMAAELGYLNVPPGTWLNADELRKLPPERITIVATGSQGEPTSALVRIANRDHRQINIISGDTVVLSASPIPGNEELVSRTIDNLFRQGAQVLYSRIAEVHVHGHASQEELKLMISLVKPRYFIPVHGEYRHLVFHTRLAHAMGVPEENTFVLTDGDVLELDERGGRVTGRVPSDYIYVDGLGVGDIGKVVLRDRRMLSKDGVLVVVIAIDKRTGQVVGQPDVISRGFIDPSESEGLMERARQVVIKAVDHGGNRTAEWNYINSKIKESLGKFAYQETKRRPMVLPVPVEV